MPNYCDCDLRISGNAKDLKDFEEFAKSDKEFLKHEYDAMSEDKNEEYPIEQNIIDFNRFVPNPRCKQFMIMKELNKVRDESEKKSKLFAYHLQENEVKKYSEGEGWYDWNCVNWGTKWNLNPHNIVLNRLSKSLFYNFHTAWTPPIPIIFAMSEKFPKLTFKLKYYENGGGFSGEIELKIGKVTINKHNPDYRGGRGG